METNQINLSAKIESDKLYLKDFFYLNDSVLWNYLLYSKNLIISLSDFTFISNNGAIWLAYIAEFRKANLNSTYFIPPSSKMVLSYLKGMGFLDIADGERIHFIRHSTFNKIKEKYTHTSIEKKNLSKLIKIYSNLSQGESRKIRNHIAQYINKVVFEEIRNSNTLNAISYCMQILIHELIKNISEHGYQNQKNEYKNKKIGIGYCSLIPPTRDNTFARYCFFDIGQGFMHTLKSKKDKEGYTKIGEISTDREAIIKGLFLRQKIPTENIVGLYPILGIICATSGRIVIRSGNSIVKLDFSKTENQRRFKNSFFEEIKFDSPIIIGEFINQLCMSTPCHKIPGSQIYIDINIKRRPDIAFIEQIIYYLQTRNI